MSAKKPHRIFTKKYKLAILSQTDKSSRPGQIGEILKREGLYPSNLAIWRRQRELGCLGFTSSNKTTHNKDLTINNSYSDQKNDEETTRFAVQLRKIQILFDVQKKIALILGL